MPHASGNATWEDYPSTATPITGLSLEQLEAAIDMLTGGHARYKSGAGTVFNFSGNVRQRIPFATVDDAHADVTASSGNTIFTLNRAGVWRIEAGIRMSTSTASQTTYLNVSDSNDLTTGGFVEVQQLRTAAGGALNVATTKRFAAGAAICATLLVLSNGTATVATDIPADTFFAVTWQRS